MPQETIVIATDLSENARAAAEAGAELAAAVGWTAEVFHVVDLSQHNRDRTARFFRNDELRQKARRRVADWYEEVTGAAPNAVGLEVGHPAINIRARAEEDDVACAAIAMSGQGAWNRFVSGSTATRLAGRPPCLLAVAHPEHHRVVEEMTIGVGVDFSDSSAVAVRKAAWFGRRFNAAVRIVHCHRATATSLLREGELPVDLTPKKSRERARRQLEKFVDEQSEVLEGIDWTSRVVDDHPVGGLRSFVERQGVDWLFLGHRTPQQRGGGSTVKGKWVQRMNCSTMLVPNPDS